MGSLTVHRIAGEIAKEELRHKRKMDVLRNKKKKARRGLCFR